jgi:hypothetical protein
MRGILPGIVVVGSVLVAGCHDSSMTGHPDGGDAPDDIAEVDPVEEVVSPDVVEEPDVPEVLFECEEPAGAWSTFMVDGTDWAREPIEWELFCEPYGGISGETTWDHRLSCVASDGTASEHTLSFGALPGVRDLRLLDLLHLFNYSATPAFRASRFFTYSAPWGELAVAGIESDTMLDEALPVGPFLLSSVHGSCESDDDELGDPERIAINVVCGSTVVSIFDGNTAVVECPEPYRIIVDEAVIYNSPEELGPDWPDKWTGVLIMRVWDP